MGFKLALIVDIKSFIQIIYIIKIDIIYLISNYIGFNFVPIVDIKSFL